MAMGASQARLLSLTSRKSNLEFEVQTLTSRRTSMVRESSKISQEYTAALQKKEFKWSVNNGSSYTKLNYNILMKPSSLNGNTPYFISDKNGKIVLNREYADYAKRFSPTGAAMSGSWADSNIRYKLLAELTGLKEEKIKANEDGIKENEMKRNNAQFYLGASDYYANLANAKLNNGTNSACTYKEWVSELCGSLYAKKTDIGINGIIKDPYFGYFDFKYIDDIQNSVLAKLFTDKQAHLDSKEDYNNFSTGMLEYEEAKILWDSFFNDSNVSKWERYINPEVFATAEAEAIKNETNVSLYISYATILDTMASEFKNRLINVVNPNKKTEDLSADERALRELYESKSADSNVVYTLYNENSDSLNFRDDGWKALVEKSENYLAYFNEVVGKEYDDAVDKNNQIFTSAEESQIKFYDRLFESIWTNGWVENNSIMDSEYLNNVLQNGQYFVTQQDYISGDEWYKCYYSMAVNDNDDKKGGAHLFTGNLGSDTTFLSEDGTQITVRTYGYGVLESNAESHFSYYPDRYEYITTMASDFSKLFSVSDSDARDEAQADYDYKKKLLETKERRIDTMLKNKQTELNSIQEMIKSVENTLKGGIERFNVFS